MRLGHWGGTRHRDSTLAIRSREMKSCSVPLYHLESTDQAEQASANVAGAMRVTRDRSLQTHSVSHTSSQHAYQCRIREFTRSQSVSQTPADFLRTRSCAFQTVVLVRRRNLLRFLTDPLRTSRKGAVRGPFRGNGLRVQDACSKHSRPRPRSGPLYRSQVGQNPVGVAHRLVGVSTRGYSVNPIISVVPQDAQVGKSVSNSRSPTANVVIRRLLMRLSGFHRHTRLIAGDKEGRIVRARNDGAHPCLGIIALVREPILRKAEEVDWVKGHG
jgi:hypothetical protein